jgi:protein-S-isoprenylcysteine O-methyltransferase Ste14
VVNRVRGLVGPVLGSAVFFCLAPGVVAGIVPGLLASWHIRPAFLGLGALRVVGVVLMVSGGLSLLDSFARFALQGRGTPAPIAPTAALVVSGQYRYVRNPMYVAVVTTILGQALLFGSTRVLGYGALVWCAFHVFVLAYEEPTLRGQFGEAYAVYQAGVRRWWPRVTPWTVDRPERKSRGAAEQGDEPDEAR